MNDKAPVSINERSPAPARDTPLESRGGPIHRVITQPPRKKFWSKKRIWWTAGSLAVLVVFYLLFFAGGARPPTFVTADVIRGPLTVTVSATGTLQPVDEVDVGAEISGRISQVLVDFNDHVAKGQILARIDTEQLAAKLAQSRASLGAADATVRTSEATLAESRARTARVQGLFKASAVSRQDLETAQADLARAAAAWRKRAPTPNWRRRRWHRTRRRCRRPTYARPSTASC